MSNNKNTVIENSDTESIKSIDLEFMDDSLVKVDFLSQTYPDLKITGGKKENGKPVKLKHFNCSDFPKIEALYGREPDKLIVAFPSTVTREFLHYSNKEYGSNNNSKVRCNGKYFQVTYEGCEVAGKIHSTGKLYKCVSPDCNCGTYLDFVAYVLGPDGEKIYYRPIRFKGRQKHGGKDMITFLRRHNKITAYPFVLRLDWIKTNTMSWGKFMLELPPDDFIDKYHLPSPAVTFEDHKKLALAAGSTGPDNEHIGNIAIPEHLSNHIEDEKMEKFNTWYNKLVDRINDCEDTESLENLKIKFEESDVSFPGEMQDEIIKYFDLRRMEIINNMNVGDLLDEKPAFVHFPGIDSNVIGDHIRAWRKYYESHPEDEARDKSKVAKEIEKGGDDDK